MFFQNKKSRLNNRETNGFSHLGENLSLEGEIECKGEIEIAGKVLGNVKAKILKVLETGKITGLIKAERIEILGNVIGNIDALSINVGKNAYIRGDLTYLNTISISEGGEVHGLIRRVSQSKTKSADSDKIRYIDQSKKISNI